MGLLVVFIGSFDGGSAETTADGEAYNHNFVDGDVYGAARKKVLAAAAKIDKKAVKIHGSEGAAQKYHTNHVEALTGFFDALQADEKDNGSPHFLTLDYTLDDATDTEEATRVSLRANVNNAFDDLIETLKDKGWYGLTRLGVTCETPVSGGFKKTIFGNACGTMEGDHGMVTLYGYPIAEWKDGVKKCAEKKTLA